MEGNAGKAPDANNNNEAPTNVAFESKQDALTFRVIPSSEYALNGVVTNMQVMFQIQTGRIEESNTKRGPIDLCVCLDRSGSMDGAKLEQSKKAIMKLIDNLFPEDRFHLVAYSSDVQVIIENGNPNSKEELHNKVKALKATGGTNMGIGLEKSADVLTKHFKSGRTLRMFLFSDGLVNEGNYRSHPQLFELVKKIQSKNITIASFGIGSDFDEDLMKGIGEYGHSFYFYIENEGQIDKYVSAALGQLLGLIGKDALLKVRGKNGGIVTKIYDCPNIAAGVVIGDIKQNNQKNILCEVSVTPTRGVQQEEILTWELSYIRCKDEKALSSQGAVKINYTDDDKLCAKNEEVVVTQAIQQMAERDNEIINLLEKGKVEEALEKRNKEVEELKKLESVDRTGRVSALVGKSLQSAKDMKERKSEQKHLLKQAKYQQKVKQFDSADATFL